MIWSKETLKEVRQQLQAADEAIAEWQTDEALEGGTIPDDSKVQSTLQAVSSGIAKLALQNAFAKDEGFPRGSTVPEGAVVHTAEA